MEPQLTDEQEENIQTLISYLCRQTAAGTQAASTAARELISELGPEIAPHIIANRAHAAIIERIPTSSTVPGIGFLNKSFDKVKVLFLKALFERMKRKLVLEPMLKLIHTISNPWSYARAVMTNEDVDELMRELGGPLGSDVLSDEMSGRFEHYAKSLKSDSGLGQIIVNDVIAGRDVRRLNIVEIERPARQPRPEPQPVEVEIPIPIPVEEVRDNNDGDDVGPELDGNPRPVKRHRPAKTIVIDSSSSFSDAEESSIRRRPQKKVTKKQPRPSRPAKVKARSKILNLVSDEEFEDDDSPDPNRFEDEIDKLVEGSENSDDRDFINDDEDNL